MDIISIIGSLLGLVVSIIMLVAILRIFSIDATQEKILKKLGEMDQHRRDEFNAMTQQDGQ